MMQIEIVNTGKRRGEDSFSRFGTEIKNFPDIAAANAFLVENYANVKKRVKIYEDIGGESVHCGFVYRFQNADFSHAPVQKWMQEDWVSFQEVNPVNLAAK